MSINETSDLWWKNAVVYCLDVETFLDSDGDGCGDFRGLTESLDYLAGLGVTCVWLMPFYPSPGRDDGYDVSDFFAIDPAYGTLGDFVEFVRTAEDRGIRVIADLVVNHTSTLHPWFLDARSSRESRYRDYYVWVDEPPDGGEIVFPDTEASIWEYDERSGQHYLHRFYREQADLNFANPQVREEIHKVIGFWLRLGLSGFRVDAVPFLLSEEKLNGYNGDPHVLLRDLRNFLSRRQGDAVLLGEVNLQPQDQLPFFGGDHGDELHMVFNFVLNQAVYLALTRGEAAPVAEVLARLPRIPAQNQWANFVRNHDELTLDKLSEAERQDVFAALGPDPDVQLFGRGLRLRLPSMVDGDRRRLECVYSLMFSLPGTPVLLYGEEIGMGENLDIPGRRSVRAPMQWSAEAHGGFSPPGTPSLCRPAVEGRFGPKHVNVADQRRDPESLLNWMERLIRRRRECPEIGWGSFEVIADAPPSVLLHRVDWEDRTLLAAHNLGADATRVSLRLPDHGRFGGMIDLLGPRGYQELDGEQPIELALDGYGYRWLRLHRRGARLHL
jgi:trehalose synthase